MGTCWRNRLNKALSIVLVLTILGVIAALVYVATTPKLAEESTVFYILSPGGKAADYPEELKVGEEGTVILGIINQEHETVSYRLEVKTEMFTSSETSAVVLGHGEKWERAVSFTPVKAGDKQKVEFVLYKEEKPYRWLHLWIEVTR